MNMHPTPDMTFDLRKMPKRKKPNKHHFLNRMGEREQAMKKLKWLQDRHTITPIAEAQWRDLNIVYRAWLALRGYTPISWYEAQR